MIPPLPGARRQWSWRTRQPVAKFVPDTQPIALFGPSLELCLRRMNLARSDFGWWKSGTIWRSSSGTRAHWSTIDRAPRGARIVTAVQPIDAEGRKQAARLPRPLHEAGDVSSGR